MAVAEFATKLVNAADPMKAWSADHDHDLHAFDRMQSAINRHFTIREVVSVPYLYRDLIAVLSRGRASAAWLDQVLREEVQLGARGEIVQLGRRVVAHPREPD